LPNKAQYFALGIASAGWVDRRSARSFALVLAATLVLCIGHGNAEKMLPPLIWTLCLAAQLHPARMSLIAIPLRYPIVRWFGAISYPIYLANEPIQKALCYVLAQIAAGDPVLFTAVWLPASLLIPIGVAAALHRYIETPAQTLGRALAHHGVALPDQAIPPRAATGQRLSTRPPRTPTYQS
jgi:peptidoglycan/LPS O-acetylase OafA/YrhL